MATRKHKSKNINKVNKPIDKAFKELDDYYKDLKVKPGHEFKFLTKLYHDIDALCND